MTLIATRQANTGNYNTNKLFLFIAFRYSCALSYIVGMLLNLERDFDRVLPDIESVVNVVC